MVDSKRQFETDMLRCKSFLNSLIPLAESRVKLMGHKLELVEQFEKLNADDKITKMPVFLQQYERLIVVEERALQNLRKIFLEMKQLIEDIEHRIKHSPKKFSDNYYNALQEGYTKSNMKLLKKYTKKIDKHLNLLVGHIESFDTRIVHEKELFDKSIKYHKKIQSIKDLRHLLLDESLNDAKLGKKLELEAAIIKEETAKKIIELINKRAKENKWEKLIIAGYSLSGLSSLFMYGMHLIEQGHNHLQTEDILLAMIAIVTFEGVGHLVNSMRTDQQRFESDVKQLL